MANIVRMRSIKDCTKHFKEEDKETKISEHYIRMLVKQRKIPVFHAGTRQLINLDVLINFLSAEFVEEDQIPFNDYGQIRRVSE